MSSPVDSPSDSAVSFPPAQDHPAWGANGDCVPLHEFTGVMKLKLHDPRTGDVIDLAVLQSVGSDSADVQELLTLRTRVGELEDDKRDLQQRVEDLVQQLSETQTELTKARRTLAKAVTGQRSLPPSAVGVPQRAVVVSASNPSVRVARTSSSSSAPPTPSPKRRSTGALPTTQRVTVDPATMTSTELLEANRKRAESVGSQHTSIV